MQEREKSREMEKTVETQPVVSDDTPKQEKFQISISDPKIEENKVRSLYDALLNQKKKNSEDTIPSYRQFVKYIESQTKNTRNKHGCTHVTYVIALKDGSVRFTVAAKKT